MKVCDDEHDEVSYVGERCPVCRSRDELSNIPIDSILKTIENDLVNLDRWYEDRIEGNITSSTHHIECLLYLCESFMVGKTGGFDAWQNDRSLKGRCEWLRGKLGVDNG